MAVASTSSGSSSARRCVARVAAAEVGLHEGQGVGGEQVRAADRRGDHQVDHDVARPQQVDGVGHEQQDRGADDE